MSVWLFRNGNHDSEVASWDLYKPVIFVKNFNINSPISWQMSSTKPLQDYGASLDNIT